MCHLSELRLTRMSAVIRTWTDGNGIKAARALQQPSARSCQFEPITIKPRAGTPQRDLAQRRDEVEVKGARRKALEHEAEAPPRLLGQAIEGRGVSPATIATAQCTESRSAA